MTSFSLGRYVPYNSFLHRMDPRAKILCAILLMVSVFLGFANWSMTFTMAGLAFIFFLILLFWSHTSLRSLLSSLKSLWFMALFLLIIYVLIPRTTGWVAFYIGSFPIYWDSIFDALKILVRLFLMIEVTMILTSCTKPLDLTYALEFYLTPFKYIGFPSHEVAMIISLALRFIPTILEDVSRIMRAQESRGVDFKRGKISTRIRAIVSLIIPLFVSSILRSEELADAMICRGYDPKAKRTRYRVWKFNYLDILATLAVMGFCALFIYVSVTYFDAYSFFWGLTVR